jgi:hypothetical protein
VGDGKRTIASVSRFLRAMDGWREALKSARLSTTRRGLEILGFAVESGPRGGNSLVYARERSEGTAAPYAFVCIDVFSKYAHAVPMWSKKPAETAAALDACVDKMGVPSNVLSDEGGEFKSVFSDRVRYYAANQLMVRTHAYFVERVILTLKNWLLLRIRALGGTWEEHLPAVLRRYNRVVHSATGMTPLKAAKDENRDEVYDALKKPVVVHRPRLEVGDRVRLLKKPSKSARFAHVAWSRQTYEVLERTNHDGSDFYKLKDAPEDGWYLRFELLRP